MKDHPIVIATDFTADSVRALHWVAKHVAGDAPVVGVHAVDVPEPGLPRWRK